MRKREQTHYVDGFDVAVWLAVDAAIIVAGIYVWLKVWSMLPSGMAS